VLKSRISLSAWKLVPGKDALGAEAEGSVHMPNSDQTRAGDDLGKGLNGLTIGLEPQVLAGEVVEDVGAEPVLGARANQ